MAFEDRSCWYQSILLRVSESAVLCCSKDVTEHVSNEDRRIMMRVLDTMGKLPVAWACSRSAMARCGCAMPTTD